MNLPFSRNVILNIIEKKPGLGKTAIMKNIYMLQQVKGVPLGYDFSIYTYGPYSAELAEDVDSLISDGLINATMYPYANYVGYQLKISTQGKEALSILSTEEREVVDSILTFADGKTAKELELSSTIVYISNLFFKNEWENTPEDIKQNVHEIKPHFDMDVISCAYEELVKAGFINNHGMRMHQ